MKEAHQIVDKVFKVQCNCLRYSSRFEGYIQCTPSAVFPLPRLEKRGALHPEGHPASSIRKAFVISLCLNFYIPQRLYFALQMWQRPAALPQVTLSSHIMYLHNGRQEMCRLF